MRQKDHQRCSNFLNRCILMDQIMADLPQPLKKQNKILKSSDQSQQKSNLSQMIQFQVFLNKQQKKEKKNQQGYQSESKLEVKNSHFEYDHQNLLRRVQIYTCYNNRDTYRIEKSYVLGQIFYQGQKKLLMKFQEVKVRISQQLFNLKFILQNIRILEESSFPKSQKMKVNKLKRGLWNVIDSAFEIWKDIIDCL